MKKQTATLTPEEDSFWVETFNYYKNMSYSDIQADKLTFKELIKHFPRLKGYTNIK